jgi:hypothetical protein
VKYRKQIQLQADIKSGFVNVKMKKDIMSADAFSSQDVRFHLKNKLKLDSNDGLRSKFFYHRGKQNPERKIQFFALNS